MSTWGILAAQRAIKAILAAHHDSGGKCSCGWPYEQRAITVEEFAEHQAEMLHYHQPVHEPLVKERFDP